MAKAIANDNPLSIYGYDQKTANQLADQYGMTTQQLADAFAATPLTGGSAPQTTSYGMTTGGSAPGRDLDATLQTLKMMKAAGMGASSASQSGQAPSSTPGGVSSDPMNAMTNLGAAALGMGAVYNPTPGQIPQGSKGGVAQVASPVSSSAVPGVPQGPWTTNASVFANQNQAQGNQVYQQLGGKENLTPAQNEAFRQVGVAQGTIPSGSGGPATGGTPTPRMPANAPGGAGAAATPWATAPAAPGASATAGAGVQGASQEPDWGSIAQHTAGLENAGKAIYAHMTGNDPANASHAELQDFHTQLQTHIGAAASAMSNAMSGGGTPFGQAPPAAANFTAGVQPGIAATGATPGAALGVAPPAAPGMPKMAGGGFVPGRGSGDTVPALLTPGEYVIPKQQAAQIFGGREPVRMAEGGFVWDDPNQPKKPPPETRRTTIGGPAAAASTPFQGQPSPSPQQGSDKDSDSDKPSATNNGYWSNMVNQAQAARANQQFNAMGSGGYSGGGGQTVGDVADGAAIAGGGQTQDLGQLGGGAANTAAGVADVASGLVSGLQKAVDTYAKSIKPWQVQAQAFGKQGTPNYQGVNLQQNQEV